jgi:hypothetical protein
MPCVSLTIITLLLLYTLQLHIVYHGSSRNTFAVTSQQQDDLLRLEDVTVITPDSSSMTLIQGLR